MTAAKNNFYLLFIKRLGTSSAQLLLLRMVSAIALFSLLGQANVWLDTTSNALLAFGYRFLLILTPLTL
ncbi:TPA: hypothetical protein ACXNMF_003968, partial [Klebsiella aerogenes]